MLEVACERAQIILPDQVFFQFNNEKINQFLDFSANNTGLERLILIETPWKKI